MEDTKTVKASIDYPQEDETITSPHYTFRIKAPLNAEKVEVCVDGAPWQLCRYSSGFWWYDWSGYFSGEHEIVARILPFDSKNYTLRTRRCQVMLPREVSPADGMLTQYSVLTSNEPWMLAKVTQLLSREEVSISGLMTMHLGETASIQFLADKSGALREKLENAGLRVLESEVFHVKLPNNAREINKLCESLAEKQISVRSMYGTVEGGQVKLVLSVDKPENAATVVGEFASSCR